MSDYIKREDVIKTVVDHSPLNAEEAEYIFSGCRSTDVVEVIRCRDCKYWKPYTSQYGSGQFCECPCSFGGQGIKKPDDYCSYGERRDDKEYNNSILNAQKGEE